MPVLITAVNRDLDIVIPLAAKLLTGGGEVRCYLEYDDHELRTMGCKIAVGDLDDAYTMGAALTNVHTFIPLLADPLSFTDASDQLTSFGAAAAEAAADAGLGQTILAISVAGGKGNAIFDAMREIEEAFLSSVKPLCVLKTGFIAGADRPLRLAGSSDPGKKVSAVEVVDLVAAIAAADDRERIDGVWELAGQPLAVSPQENGDSTVSGLFASPLVLGNSAADEFELSSTLPAGELS